MCAASDDGCAKMSDPSPRCPTQMLSFFCVIRDNKGWEIRPLASMELSSCFLGFQKSTLRALENRLDNGVRKGELLFSPFPNFSPTCFSVNLLRDLPNQGCKANAHRGIRNLGVQWDR